MKRSAWILCLLTISLGVGSQAWAYQPSPNLLQNPSFEGEYSAWMYINEAQVAPCWTPWWRDRTEADEPATYFKPEYKKADGYVFPNRVHSGAAAQQWFTFYSTHQAGMYQQVFNVMPGTRYRFSIWAQTWSSSEDNPDYSVNAADPHMQVGIDPTGHWNPFSGRIIWSDVYAFHNTWGQLAVEAVAEGNVLTVFMRSAPNWPVKHNDMYWDDAELVAVGPGGASLPTRPPSAALPTALPATVPGDQPVPTATLAGTPLPTATCAPRPTGWLTYTVKPGDTLAALAKASGTTLQELAAANCIRAVNLIEVGQKVLVPALPAISTSTARPATATSATPTRSYLSPTAVPPTPRSTPTAIPTASRVPTLTPSPTAIPSPTAFPSATPLPPTTTAVAPPVESVLVSQPGGVWLGVLAAGLAMGLGAGFWLGRRRG